MTDFPETTIGTDNVDSEMVEQPRRWNVKFIRNFMIVFGILSSVFDYIAFGVLIFVLHSPMELFRTGWFVESVLSASLIVLVIRSRRPFFKSFPGKYLIFATVVIVVATLILPFTSLGKLFGFAQPSLLVLVLMAIIVVFYILMGEVVKRIFYKRVKL
jgi:P-type Mg2+ transporter